MQAVAQKAVVHKAVTEAEAVEFAKAIHDEGKPWNQVAQEVAGTGFVNPGTGSPYTGAGIHGLVRKKYPEIVKHDKPRRTQAQIAKDKDMVEEREIMGLIRAIRQARVPSSLKMRLLDVILEA